MPASLQDRWDSSVQHLVVDLTQSVQRENKQLSVHSQLDPTVSDAISATSEKWFNKVFMLYHEPHRAYHNWTHVEDVLASLDFLLKERIQQQMGCIQRDVTITTLAAFFHDVIYNPKSSTNERDSADLFLEFVAELVVVISSSSASETEAHKSSTIAATAMKSEITSAVAECIIASATHIASAMQAKRSNNQIVAIFLDADISILGKCSNVYDRYASSIRKEYIFVEKNVYCEKRAEILESFLPVGCAPDANGTENAQERETKASSQSKSRKAHQFIFATEDGQSEWEDNARRNLRREVEMLQRGVIPCEEVNCPV
ncbi:hypothetical protein HJC23_002970 [Cyclotella cryptica]|uniref:HD/PDEase domain-containing protein n=1 Tax=Cyclotella cryptica TaxID=29204 RepID=A0ABD3PEC9_9STRA|eukprot:CCRYP_015249-RA/>CCRYP_015249-RA protein AED:0.44 eAED:0.44 QI:0/-1/0/1/-1/1/1/0/315